MTTRVQILDKTDCISHSTNTLGKGMNPIILSPAMGKQQGRLGSSALMRQLVQEKENSKFRPVKLHLKIDLVSYPARAEGLVNMDTTLSDITTLGQKMAMKGYSASPKVPALLKTHHQIVKCHIRTLIEGVLPLCRDAVGVFYSPS